MKVVSQLLLYISLVVALLLAGCSKPYKTTPKTTTSLHSGWEFRQVGTEKWRSATVPGCVHTDLLAHGLIPDPFYGTNEKAVQWVEEKDWEYRLLFTPSEQELASPNATLVFEGLDTYADVYLNDDCILIGQNMFRGFEISVAAHLNIGESELRIVFHSPTEKTKERFKENGYELPAGNDQADVRVSVYSRKAPYHFGWDWGPRLVTSGIWKPVSLVTWSLAQITNVHHYSEAINAPEARIKSRFEVESYTATKATLKKTIGDMTYLAQTDLKKGHNIIDLDANIPSPQLWWPNGLGKQHLYTIKSELIIDGVVIDSRTDKLGLRSIEVVNEPDSIGHSFYVKVNGQPVFMKGANIIPLDNFLPNVSQADYDELIDAALDANMNMLRVWGGGIYEDKRFYDLCDEKGILVWQDFMFSCAMYPGDSAFLEEVKAEAQDNIRRLRNHTSLALWCGNNEVDVAWHNWGWQNQFNYSSEDSTQVWSDYLKLFEELLPAVVAENDSHRFYLPSSPISNWGTPENFNHGDMHYWGVWHGNEPLSAFNTNVGRFMSEFGFQSFPELATVKAFSDSTGWSLESDVMQAHQKSPGGNVRIKRYMDQNYREPKDFESFLYVSQLLQAKGMKTALEAHRRNMPHCMGTLYWQLNDCWPVASWSSMDYYGRRKAAHYATKRAFSEVAISVVEEGDSTTVYLISDRDRGVTGNFTVQLFTLSGELIDRTDTELLGVYRSKVHFKKATQSWLKDHRKEEVVVKVRLEGGNFDDAVSYYYFVPPKELKLPTPKLDWHFKATATGGIISLTAESFIKDLYLNFPGVDGHFLDNYFDLIKGETKEIIFETEAGTALSNAQLSWMSLYDSYEKP